MNMRRLALLPPSARGPRRRRLRTRSTRGGFPLIEGGKIIGGIGCSGGTGSQDAASCAAAVALVK